VIPTLIGKGACTREPMQISSSRHSGTKPDRSTGRNTERQWADYVVEIGTWTLSARRSFCDGGIS
jgi:hypothetical protein